MEQSSSLEHESQDQNELKAVLEDQTDSMTSQQSDTPAVVNDTDDQEDTEDDKESVVEALKEEPSITDSIVQITKSQVLASEQEEANARECHTNPEFITSGNEHMIESTYHDETDNVEQEAAEVLEEKEDAESEPEEENKEAEDDQETEVEKEDMTGADAVVEALENSEEMQNEILELRQSLITSVDLRGSTEEEQTKTEEAVPVDSGLTESCVDLGVEDKTETETADEQEAQLAVESNEVNVDDAANASMEIIDKKQCEEAFEKIEAVEPKRRLENEVFEKPLGGDSLLKKITQYGEEMMGRDWRPSSGQMCTISFEARIKGSEVVVEKNEELNFILGDGDVISAIDLVVSLMAKNEKCEMITEARHAYGTLGKKPDIPAGATLCYNIHLKEFKDLTEFSLMEPVERLSLSEAKKLRGNFHFNRQDFPLAIQSYKRGLKYFDLENLRSDEEKEDLEKFVAIRKALLMNLALSYFKQTEFRKALDSLNDVLDIEKSHMKALYIKGKVLMSLGETQEAIQSLSKAHELAKDNVEVKNELAKAQQKHKIQYEKEKKMYQKMMQSPDAAEKKKKAGEANAKKGTSPLVSYTIAGLLMASATLGVALLAKYKNLL